MLSLDERPRCDPSPFLGLASLVLAKRRIGGRVVHCKAGPGHFGAETEPTETLHSEGLALFAEWARLFFLSPPPGDACSPLHAPRLEMWFWTLVHEGRGPFLGGSIPALAGLLGCDVREQIPGLLT